MLNLEKVLIFLDNTRHHKSLIVKECLEKFGEIYSRISVAVCSRDQSGEDSKRYKNNTLSAEVVESINCMYCTRDKISQNARLSKIHQVYLGVLYNLLRVGVDVHVLILYTPLVSCLLYSIYNCIDIVMI